jgi:hypothetical protein
MWQGISWLVLAAVGFSVWVIALPAGLGPGSGSGAVLWAGGQLLAIGIGAGMGAGEIGMACKLRGGPRWVLRATAGLDGVSLGTVLVIAAVSVMVVGSVLELLALSGVLLPAPAGARLPRYRRCR